MMKPEVKKYTITVFGDSYTVVSDESEERILNAALLVDRLMKEIASKASDMPSQKVAILTALKIALQMQATSLEHDETKAAIKNLIQAMPSL
jgi:cell division protein ZapA (FtsZ GTPase activity inhibitor)